MEDTNVSMALLANLSALIIGLGVLAAVVLNTPKRQRRRHKTWVKDILRKRNEEGTFSLLIPQLLSDDGQYRNFLRMSKNSFQYLLSCLEPSIKKSDTRFGRSISASEKLALTLRYLATGLCLFATLITLL